MAAKVKIYKSRDRKDKDAPWIALANGWEIKSNTWKSAVLNGTLHLKYPLLNLLPILALQNLNPAPENQSNN